MWGGELAGCAMQSSVKTVEAAVKSARVLIVDDEFYVRKAVRTLLLSMGVIDVHEAPDGASGLACVRALGPDVVLLDWQMTDLNGPEFVREVRASQHPNVRIIILTGHGGHSWVAEAIRLGVHEFLVKPVVGRALHERLASILTPRPAAHDGPAPRRLPRQPADLQAEADTGVQPWGKTALPRT
jgi:two-component system chemotaxis response regulator CheY